MGNLTPGATYIYEHADGVTYAREFGHTERVEIGRTIQRQELDQELNDAKFWGDIRRAARQDPALQEALDRAIMIYRLKYRE
jgi:hypothetical protein